MSRRLLEELGREPNDEDIGEEIGITREPVREIIRFAQSPISLETPDRRRGGRPSQRLRRGREAVSPSDAASLTMLYAELEEVLDTVTPRERRVIQLRFGLNHGHQRTLEEAASDSRSPASASVRPRSGPFTNSATPLARRNFALTWSSPRRQDARLKSSMPDLGQRLANNPILSSRDVAPSQAALEVVSVFNAAAATVGEETILLLRVGERPRAMTGLLPATARTLDPTAPEKGLQSLPTGMLGENTIGVAFLDPVTEPPRVVVAYVRKDLPGVDLSDPRTIRVRMPSAKPGGAEEVRDYLTQISHLRVARSTDGAHFEVDPLPAVSPVDSLEEYGCEDPRATLIDGVWHITYVSVGQLGITTSRLTTTDFRSFQRCGIMFLPDHKDVVLFPGQVRGRYVALTRPMPASFNRVLGIWIAFSDDMVSWGGHRPLALPRKGMWDALRTGAGAVPFRVPEGWLELYHGVNVDGQYAMGALLLDAEDPSRIVGRSPDPILVPREEYETSGFYNNTVFSCGHIPLDDRGERIRMYYGSADSCMAAADFDVKEIVDSLIQC